MKHKKLATIALCFLTSTTSLAFGMRNASLNPASQPDCGMRSNNGNANAIREMNCMLNPESCLHQAAWYQDRDNSLEDADDEIGRSMAFISGSGTYTLGIKLSCPNNPNAYIMTGHGAVDREGENGLRYVDPFPISDNNYADDFSQSRVISPWLGNSLSDNDRNRRGQDYAIVLVNENSNLQHDSPGVRPVRGSVDDIISAENNGRMNVSLYRGRTRYQTDDQGRPLSDSDGNFLTEGIAETFDETVPVYDVPQRVRQNCRLIRAAHSGYIGHDCPTEQSVSGGALIAELNGQGYLLGLNASGDSSYYEEFEDDNIPNAFVPSAAFCNDYESACGQPCVELDEVLPQNDDGVSI